MSSIAIIFFSWFLLSLIGFHIALYFLFQKAGKETWKSFVPVVNMLEWLKILQKPTWWIAMLFIPGVNLFYFSTMVIESLRHFGKYKFIDDFLSIVALVVYLPYTFYKEKYIGPSFKSPKSSILREWSEALIFAFCAAYLIRLFVFELYTIPTPSMEKTLLVGDFLFVSKFHYGARVPMTPLAIPIFHHSLPSSNTPAYLDWIKLPYMRLPKLEPIKRYDMVVFNFPAGDTFVVNMENPTYYDIVRELDNSLKEANRTDIKPVDIIKEKYEIKTRPVDKRENYIKRCVAIPNDKLEVKDGVLYINDSKAFEPENIYLPYTVIMKNGNRFSPENEREYEIENISNRYGNLPDGHQVYLMKKETVQKLATVSAIENISMAKYPNGYQDAPYANIFPNNFKYNKWNVDQFGPIQIPGIGTKLILNDSTINQYSRIIGVYEGNQLEQKDGKIFINGKETTEYTCKMNYYWMMGDNRHNSQDSRFWGFVPEDHIVGKAWFIIMSLDYNADLFHKIRWNRLFTNIHSKWAVNK